MDDRNELNRCARVFISCGQNKDSDELEAAHKIRDRLKEPGFDPYIAVEEQTLRGLKENIFPQLQDSEYFVFVDFKCEKLVPHRRAKTGVVSSSKLQHRGSLFSHQELALASFLDLQLLAFQEKGVKQDDGILRFLQANAIPFTDRNVLPNVIADEVQRRKWNPHSRNELVLERDPEQYADHQVQTEAGVEPRRFYYVEVRNLHHRKTATNCYVYLEKVLKLDRPSIRIPFKTVELKWSGYMLPNAHVLPQTARPVDAFAILHRPPTQLGLVSFSDSLAFGRLPIHSTGEYELRYAVVSDNFPIARASFVLSLSDTLDHTKLKPSGVVEFYLGRRALHHQSDLPKSSLCGKRKIPIYYTAESTDLEDNHKEVFGKAARNFLEDPLVGYFRLNGVLSVIACGC